MQGSADRKNGNGHKTAPPHRAFRAARQNRIFQDIVEQIQEAILTGHYQSGESLPPEREMKEMFQTSRGTLREALRVLEQKGLIEIRLGVSGGAFVKASMDHQLAESLGLMLRYRKISLAHLNEFREDMEGIVTAKAAERADAAAVTELSALLARAGRLAEKGVSHWREFLDVDKRFHQTLARITGNPIYIFMHTIIHDNIQPYYDEYLPPDDGVLAENHRDLAEILDSVKAGRMDEAARRARSHVHRFSGHMIQRAGARSGSGGAGSGGSRSGDSRSGGAGRNGGAA